MHPSGPPLTESVEHPLQIDCTDNTMQFLCELTEESPICIVIFNVSVWNGFKWNKKKICTCHYFWNSSLDLIPLIVWYILSYKFKIKSCEHCRLNLVVCSDDEARVRNRTWTATCQLKANTEEKYARWRD